VHLGTSGPRAHVPAILGQVSLHDCLACSGCITSAETVLLQQQSSDQFLQQLAQPGVSVVVSVSAQSRSALAGKKQLRLQRPPPVLHGLDGPQGARTSVLRIL
jgi:iron only hydrogenase large subunit-like protein